MSPIRPSVGPSDSPLISDLLADSAEVPPLAPRVTACALYQYRTRNEVFLIANFSHRQTQFHVFLSTCAHITGSCQKSLAGYGFVLGRMPGTAMIRTTPVRTRATWKKMCPSAPLMIPCKLADQFPDFEKILSCYVSARAGRDSITW